jgi:tripartite ATP-independent transporter DctM subunit
MTDMVTASLFLLLLLALYLIGVPIGFSIGLTCLLLMFSPLVPYEPQLFVQGMIGGVDSFVILAVPLFLLTGTYMNMYGLTEVIFDFAAELVGPIKGGIAHVNVLASILFSGMTGAATADAAGLGTIEYKAMNQRGYRDGFSVAVTGGSSIIGPIIPPSIPIIFYGILSRQSIGALFIAGIIPGLLLGVSLLVLCTIYAHLHDYDRGEWWSISGLAKQFYRAVPALGTPALIIGGLLGGYFTATEAGAIAMFYTILIGQVFYGGVSAKKFYKVSYDGFVTTAALTFIIATASLYGFMIRRAQIPQTLSEAVTSLTTDPFLILLLIVFVLLLVGTMMEVLAAITILVPVFLPIITDAGIDPVHFGVIMVLTLMIGLLTPPFGIVLFILEKVTGVPLEKIMISIIPFYVPMLIVLLLIIIFPELVLALPRAFGLHY